METKKCKCCGRELPIEEFVRNAWGATNVCKECNTKNRSNGQKKRKALQQQAVDAVNARNLRLEDFTPRELKRRGYEFTMKYTEVHTIDSKTL